MSESNPQDWLPNQGAYNKLLNMQLVKWEKDLAVVHLEIDDRHLNTLRIAHGGVLLSAMDSALGWCGMYRDPPENPQRCMTINLTTNFHAPIRRGRLIVTARRTGGGKSVAHCEAEARDESGRLIGTATGAFKLLRERHTEAAKEQQ